MFGSSNILVILISNNTLQVYGPPDHSITKFQIPYTIISNMEIVNKDALYQLVTDWLKTRAYVSTQVIWLLGSDLCFEKTLESVDHDKIDSETVQFLDSIPFEEILSHTYAYGPARVVTATNKTLISTLVQAFSLHGYTSKIVVPMRQIQATDILTPEIAKLVIKKESDLEKSSLIHKQTEYSQTTTVPAITTSSPNKPKSQLPLLLSVFTVLLFVLGFVIYLNQ